jgi:hypothetical protein
VIDQVKQRRIAKEQNYECEAGLLSWCVYSATGWSVKNSVVDCGWVRHFLYSKASRLSLEPNQPPIQLAPVALSAEIKLPGREAHHLCHLVPKLKMKF